MQDAQTINGDILKKEEKKEKDKKKRGRPKKIKNKGGLVVFPEQLEEAKKILKETGTLYAQAINDNKASKKTKKYKLLWYGDSPTANTGFGNVSENVLEQLQNTGLFDITVLAIQYYDDPMVDLHKKDLLPYRIIAAGNNHERDMFGRKKLLNLIMNEHFDIIITFQDLPNLITKNHGCKNSIRSAIDWAKGYFQKEIKWMVYTPVDGQMKNFELEPVEDADLTAFYTRYGYFQAFNLLGKEIIKQCSNKKIQKLLIDEMTKKMCFIYHGTNTDDFYPIPREELLEFRKEYFGIDPDTFLIINVNRNQPRKDMHKTIEAYAKFKQKNPDCKAMLYLHCRDIDVGGNLNEIVEAYGKPLGIKLTQNLDVIKGCSIETLNKIYNCADLYITTTMGEGWGLTVTEAMATKLLTIIPPHSSLIEIGDDSRTLFVNCNNTVCTHEDFYRVRPVVNTDDLAMKIEMVYKSREKFKSVINNAYNWVTEITWEAVGREWIARIKELLNENTKRPL